jgi:hypothetical protein
MQRASFLKFLAKTAARLALLAFCVCLTLHLVAAVCMPVFQAFGEGLQRVNAVQVVSVKPELTDPALEVAR